MNSTNYTNYEKEASSAVRDLLFSDISLACMFADKKEVDEISKYISGLNLELPVQRIKENPDNFKHAMKAGMLAYKIAENYSHGAIAAPFGKLLDDIVKEAILHNYAGYRASDSDSKIWRNPVAARIINEALSQQEAANHTCKSCKSNSSNEGYKFRTLEKVIN